MLIAVWPARIFSGDDTTDLLFDAFAGDIFSVAAFKTALKKEFELEQALRRMDILIGGSAADRGFVHMNVFGYVAQDHRLKLAYAMFEEVLLKLENTLGNAAQGLLALLAALNQPRGRAHLFLQVLSCLLFCRALLAGHAPIERTYPQPRHAIVVQVNQVFITDLFDKNVG